jgi:transposase
MTSKTKSKTKQTRARYSGDFKAEALALADKIGVSAAAQQLGRPESQLYGWRSHRQKQQNQSVVDQQAATEIVRLKRQLAEQAEELAILKKAAAYFAKSVK